MNDLHATLSRIGGSSLDQEPGYMTPQSSPFQQHENFRQKVHDFSNNDYPLATEGIEACVGGKDLKGEPGLSNTQQNFNVAQLFSHEEQQAMFERTLRPLLLKTTKFEMPGLSSHPYGTVVGPVDASQPHDTTNGRCQQVSQNHDQQFQHPTSSDVPHIQLSSGDLPWPRPEAPPTHNTPTPTPPSNRWVQAREYRRRVHEPPYYDIHSDATIREVERDAEFWVTQLIHAMTNVQTVKDTHNSHAKRLFLPTSYDPLLIECTSRQILISLLDRCTAGFRGPTQFNKALKPGKDCEADLIASCEDRVRNVIEALMWNKRVCKDVLYEDWKIQLLVNHPKAYDKEKDCQKGSNDQRRARQVGEREKLKRTEEELLAYRSWQQL